MNPEPISPDDALMNLDKAAATVTTNRESHEILKESVRVLREVINKSRP